MIRRAFQNFELTLLGEISLTDALVAMEKIL